MWETRTLPRRSVSLHDRINKSDAEDKSLSNDETPLPTCPRQPPDGVETPSDTVEKIPDLPARLPPKLPAGWPTRTRFSYLSRSQDARSEASVKDKIAMFSNDPSSSLDRIEKSGTLPLRHSSTPRKSVNSYANNYCDVTSLDKRLTKSQDNLDETKYSHRRHSERPQAMGALENVVANALKPSNTRNTFNLSRTVESKPLFYGSTSTLPLNVDTSYKQPIYHVRSVSDDNGNKNVHKSNLEYLIEQRKKSMSKLRGLAIPEAQAPIVDLPAIKVQDPLSKSFMFKTNHSKISANERKVNSVKPTINETKWKANVLPNNIPKYSPAFKRKYLQVYTPSTLTKDSTTVIPSNKSANDFSKTNVSLNGSQFLRDTVGLTTASSVIASTRPSKLNSISSKFLAKDHKELLNDVRDYKNVEIKICTTTDIVDSDNDSAMSSTQSSYRSSASSPLHNLDSIESDNSRVSPRILHYTAYPIVKNDIPTKSSVIEKSCDEYIKRKVCRSVSSDTNISLSSSAGSAATSGSQASCSSLESSIADMDKRKVAKSYNIDTINRRNILASAKCRSGRDDNLKSPVIETKFPHEPHSKSPSPTYKTSERLTTLTSTVSAMSNKGENRRRNKLIAESDSDSDSQINIRQRKADFKNTRLKRNSSSASKNKQTDTNLESQKAEDTSKTTSEKINKELAKNTLEFSSKLKTENFKDNETSNREDEHSKLMSITSTCHINSIENKKISPSDEISLNKQTIYSNVKTETCKPKPEEQIKVTTRSIRLKRGAGTGVGLILAGGIDCEAKDVTVHRVLTESVAEKAGLKRGAKVCSINGHTMAGLTHAQSVAILKDQRSEIIIEIEDCKREDFNGIKCVSENAETKVRTNTGESGSATSVKAVNSVVTVTLEKAGGGAGLGLGLDGGRDSPQGDRPLTVKKLFAGGSAALSGRIIVGAELLSAGGISMEGFTRTQAWAALKGLPAGMVTLVLRNPN